MLIKSSIFLILFACLILNVHGSDDKEQEIDCVLSCGDDVEEWKKCATDCYGDFMDDFDKTFLSCTNGCVDKYYKPDVEETELKDLEECAEKCVEDYRQDEAKEKVQTLTKVSSSF